MKIFIGTADTASVMTELAFGFRELGHEVTTYITEKNKFYQNFKYDKILKEGVLDRIFDYTSWKFLPNLFKRIILKIDTTISVPLITLQNKKLIRNNDLFIFIWKPWIQESALFPELKKKGKKIICLHLGSDVRHKSAFEQEYKIDTSKWETEFHKGDLDRQIKKIRIHELFADIIYSVPDQAGLYLLPYNHLYLPLSKNKKIQFNIPAREIPLIIHAPSRKGIKGTDIVLKTMDLLKTDGYKFEFKLIQNMDNDDLIKLLSEADILVDELYLHGPGVLGAEAMAAGCVVATRCLNKYPFQPPVIAVTPENLFDCIKELITDIDKRILIANEAKVFVENNNNSVKIAKGILDDLNNPDKVKEYCSDFFIKNYKLPEGISLSRETKMLTQKVISKTGLDKVAEINKLKERGLI